MRVASGDPLALAAAIKREVQAIDPDQPVASKPDRRLQRSTWTDHEWTPIDTNWGLGLTRESGGNQGAALSKPPSKITLRLQSPLKRLRSALIERRLESP